MGDERVDSAFDDYLDRALRGERVELATFLDERPQLAASERERLRLRIDALAGSHPDRPLRDDGLPFERLGEFTLRARLGQGGMGVVFLAEQRSLGRTVALKIMRPELVGSSEAEKRFEREARAIAQLRHPNIVSVFAAGEERGVRYLAMELVEGESLDETLRAARGPLEPARAVRIALDVARALAAAHATQVIHRDVKPSNVRLARDGRVLLLDFGLSRSADASSLSQSGSFHGTPYYASPEQVEGASTLDARTDVYSLGATLYQCLTGKPPFEGASSVQVFQRILMQEPTPPRSLNASVSRDLQTVVLKAMEKRAADRYATAEEFAADLQALLEMRPIRAVPAGAWTRARKAVRRRPAVALLAAALALAVALGAGALWAQHRGGVLAFERELAAADSVAARGDFAAALRGYDRALGLRPDDAHAIARRSEAERAFARERARESVIEARAALELYRQKQREAAKLGAELIPLRQALTSRYMTPDEQARLAHGEDRAAESERELELDFSGVIDLANAAHAFDADNADVPRVLADAYMERWRSASERKDSLAAHHFRELVEQNDSEHLYESELSALGSFTIATDPPGAEVSLFRFVEQSALVPGGDHRLVPVPVDLVSGGELTTPIAAGAWVLRVERGAGAIEAGDQIVRVAGHPIESTVLVFEDGAEVRALDRVVSIGGHAVRDIQDANALGADGPLREFVFERDARTFALSAQSWKELAVRAPTLAWLLERRAAPVTVFRRGELLQLDGSPGVIARISAIPLFDSPGCGAGATPLAARELRRGSYLALIRAPGLEALKLPFVVEPGTETALSARLDPLGTTPPGFVRVAAGPFRAGGDPDAFASWPSSVRDLPDFWMAEREVTENEYVEFLNDPATQDEIDASSVTVRVPRDPTTRANALWRREPDGRYVVPWPNSNYAVKTISPDDASAFARWKTRRSRESGEGWEYALPTEEEWEKAARGVDGRAFVYGDRFCSAWAKGLHARERDGLYAEKLMEPGLRFPIDESVYGVFDLSGNAWEICADAWDFATETHMRCFRGGSELFVFPANFRVAARAGLSEFDAEPSDGIRLVVRNARERALNR